jgi:hypothetical protein
MGFLQMIIWAMKKGCTDGRRDQLRKQFHGREGEVTRGSSCRRGNRVFLGLRQEFLLSGFSDEGKKGQENFRSVVQESMSAGKVLTTKRTRHFSRRARQYKCAHFKIWKDLDKQQHDRMGAEVDTITHEADPISVEKLVKQFRTHHCALDFDTTLCKATYVNDLT